ncbi:SEFIR domain-containing protein [Paenisporosarcina sp.]|uniref:SEFIR domain-containing protein n=1 Tax=Paenisporosarcina sp. TaxID=1932001 RepID=UPI003C70B139
MISRLSNPKVFISYSWTTPEHEEWVVELATRLMGNGIEVILDKWNLREGHDVFAFMEGMVKDSDPIDKVLIICDKGYKEKSDKRVGGVGTEAQIITPQIYKDIQQEKFIPIVAQRDQQGNNFIPTYIASRLYIDLSSNEYFEENYDKLIRNIFKVPLFKKPALGKPPEYLFQPEVPHFQTSLVLREMRLALEKYPNRLPHLWTKFTDCFMDSLDVFEIEIKEDVILDDTIIEMIDRTIPLRNDYIDALEIMSQTDTVNADQIIDFFEKIYAFSEFKGSGRHYDYQTDQHKFLITELFLYTISLLLKSKNYSLASQVLNADFYVESAYNSERTLNYTDFRFYLKSLDIRKQRLNLNRLSIHADLIKERFYKRYGNELVITDLILHFISKLTTNDATKWRKNWFPTSYIYHGERKPIKLINRLKSESHFLNVKILLNVETVEELKEKIAGFESDRGYSGGFDGIPNIRNYIQVDEIGTTP